MIAIVKDEQVAHAIDDPTMTDPGHIGHDDHSPGQLGEPALLEIGVEEGRDRLVRSNAWAWSRWPTEPLRCGVSRDTETPAYRSRDGPTSRARR